ncbi:MAG: flippase-like domain-containing protein [Anaerolineales bacterium]|nr:flippase-like domain-containing protein [Anaerolineales bacterium]
MKKKLQFIAKFAVSFALIWYLFSRTDLTDVYASLKSANLFWLTMAFITLYIGKVLTGYRWQKLLEAQNIFIPLRTLIASVFVGQFFNTFLPSTVGGDAVRAYDTAIYSGESTKSVTSVFADRLIGVVALVFLAIIGIGFGLLQGEDVSFYVIPVLVVFFICVLSFIVVFNKPLSERVQQLVRSLKINKVADKIKQAYISLHVLRDNKAIMWIAFVISFALQINVVFFYYFIGVSLDMNVSIFYFFIIVPVALVILLVPFSVNGVGLREGIFVILLGNIGVPSELAIALSLLSFGLTLTQGVIGGIIFALRNLDVKSSTAQTLADSDAK